MTQLAKSTFLFLFLIANLSLRSQETYYISDSGNFVKSENKAAIKLTIEEVDDQSSELFYSEKNGEKWTGHKFLQKAIQLSDSVIEISNSKKMSDVLTRVILKDEGDSKLIKQVNEDGVIEFVSEVLHVFPLERHGKTTVFDLQGLPMLEEYYLLGKKNSQTLLFNPVDSHEVITKVPEFPGGTIEFLKEIARKIKYPIHDMKNGNGGNTFVKFKIDENGKMCDAQTAIVPESSLNKELLRVIQRIDAQWYPAESNGRKIPVWYYATVNFRSPGF